MSEMLAAIMEDIAGFLYEYALVGILIAGTVVLGYVVAQVCLNRKAFLVKDVGKILFIGEFAEKLMWLFFLAFYSYIVIGITILSRSESGTRQASFELFRTFRNTFFARKQIYENIIMFVPYAVLLYGLSEKFRKIGRVFLIGIISSLFIEVTQWLTKTGYFEVDDVWTNTMGMLLGYGICALANRILEYRKCRNVF